MLRAALLLIALAALAPPAAAQTVGHAPDTVLFGQSAATSGPARALGLGMRAGILAAFEEANRAGGVAGRRLELVTLDDAYEPEAAIENTRDLIHSQGVFALVGGVGTPTSKAAEPIASAAGVPYIGPFTGAQFLRSKARPTVVNVRASYYQETEEMVARLTEDLGVDRIAVLYQDNSYGQAGLTGVLRALDRRGLSPVAKGSYVRNTTAVKTALLEIRRGRPQAVITIGAYEPVAQFILWARKIGLDATFINISFTGANALAESLGPDGNGIYVTQVVPLPWDEAIPIIADYRAALAAWDPAAEPGFVSLEGYIVGRLVIAALERVGQNLTRESFLDALREAPFDLGGVVLEYGRFDNQGSDQVFLTVIGEDGVFRAVDRIEP